MKSLRNALKTSPKLETEGITLEQGNTRVKLCRAGGANTAFNAAMTKVMNEHGRALKTGAMDDNKATAILHTVYAQTVIAGWETNINGEWVDGIENETGDGVVPASLENIVAYFAEVPEWFRIVKETAEDAQFYREALISGIAGN